MAKAMSRAKAKSKPKPKSSPKRARKISAPTLKKASAKTTASPKPVIDQGLRDGIATLARIMENARRDLAALQANDLRLRDLPGATDELSAVVAATEDATHSILDAVEGIETIAGELAAAQGDAIRNNVTRIYEACNFQDITGQRIAKVVGVLKEVDKTVLGLMEAFGIALDAQAAPSATPAKTGEAALLNGPQLAGAAQDQAAIDALFGDS
ncbi:MAG: protein phosphatase CheZ [Proteobacteria bacterium]|nr:protein phosphatase CheZ [Pseudomonadota bacterium]